MRRFPLLCKLAVLLLVVFAAACGVSPTPAPTTMPAAPEVEYETLDAKNFSRPTTIDNEWMPMKPGMRSVYEGTIVDEDNEKLDFRLEFTVTNLTKEIGGVRTVVAWIEDFKAGELVEKEIAFYAQDNDGTVWYLGEHPEEYEDGNFLDAPTWIHGYAGARAGIKMVKTPKVELPDFSQGWGPAVDFKDRGKVSQLGLKSCVPVDCYEDVLLIDEFSLVEPDAFQEKYYARGVGNIRVGWRGADAQKEELELVELEQIGADALAEVRAKALAVEKHAYEVSKDVYAHTTPAQ